jgi:adenosylcobinamide-GDP ribazoletransferase
MSLPMARQDGLAANTGRPDLTTVATAGALALIISLLLLPLADVLFAVLIAVTAAIGMAWLAQRHIGGQTGDVLGAAEQVGETAILVLLAARLA